MDDAAKREILDGLASLRAEVSSGFTAVNRRLDAMEGRLAKVEGRLAKVEHTVFAIATHTLSPGELHALGLLDHEPDSGPDLPAELRAPVSRPPAQ